MVILVPLVSRLSLHVFSFPVSSFFVSKSRLVSIRFLYSVFLLVHILRASSSRSSLYHRLSSIIFGCLFSSPLWIKFEYRCRLLVHLAATHLLSWLHCLLGLLVPSQVLCFISLLAILFLWFNSEFLLFSWSLLFVLVFFSLLSCYFLCHHTSCLDLLLSL